MVAPHDLTDEQLAEASKDALLEYSEAKARLGFLDAEKARRLLVTFFAAHPDVKSIEFDVYSEYDDEGSYYDCLNVTLEGGEEDHELQYELTDHLDVEAVRVLLDDEFPFTVTAEWLADRTVGAES